MVDISTQNSGSQKRVSRIGRPTEGVAQASAELSQESFPRVTGSQILPRENDSFLVLRAADARRLDLSSSRGLSQDYFNCFNRLVFPFEPGLPEELQQTYVERVVGHIAAFPRYEDHIKKLIDQTGVRVTVGEVLHEAEGRGVDLEVFDRIIAHIKEVGLSAADQVGDPDTQTKIFQLRLWVYLAGEIIYGWRPRNDEHLSILHVEPGALEKHHQTYDASLFKKAA